MHYLMQNLDRYLMSCRGLTAFCSHNGWIDTKTLEYDIIEQNDHHVIAFVQFEEIILEGANGVAERILCEGRLCLTLDRYGQVDHAELL
jgi:hypothetical protein